MLRLLKNTKNFNLAFQDGDEAGRENDDVVDYDVTAGASPPVVALVVGEDVEHELGQLAVEVHPGDIVFDLSHLEFVLIFIIKVLDLHRVTM